jgi:ABC-type Fe3+-citrate transport system substrate-binding protein
MDNIIKLNILIKQLVQIAPTLDLSVLFEDLTEQVSSLTKINNSMVSEINSKNKQLKLKDEEIANFTKVSFIQSLNKQLN